MEIDGIKVCEPIENLVNYLLSRKFKIADENVSDYHFHELYFKVEGNVEVELPWK